MTSDKTSRSRRYRISRVRNVLVNTRDAIGELGTLPEGLEQISRRVFQEYENIEELIALLEAADEGSAGPHRRNP